MNASIRAVFKKNALTESDAVLFSLPGPIQGREEMGEEEVEGMIPHPLLENYGYTMEPGEGGLGVRAKNIARGAITVIYVVCYYVVRFWVPPVYSYLVTFLMLFVLGFGLVLVF
jgi:hypothetical protein